MTTSAITPNRNIHAFEPFEKRPLPSSGRRWEALSLSAMTGFDPSHLHKIHRPEKPADLPTTPLDFDKWPDEDKILLLTFFDLPDLAKFSTLGKDANALASDPQIWRSIAARLKCPINNDFPIYKQVLGFIENLRRAAASEYKPSADDITKILKRPTIDQINHVQKWLKARDTIFAWNTLRLRYKSWPMIRYGSPVVEFPELDNLNTSQEVIAKAREYSSWANANRDVLIAIDTLHVWVKLASSINELPGFGDLDTEDAVIDKAGEFSEWFEAHRAALVQLTELKLSDCPLTSLPIEIGYLTQLLTLDLSYNQLTTLPSEIGKLTLLTHLNLCGNQLTSLPDEFANLTQLQEFYLTFNQFTILPDWIVSLTQLKNLNLGGNQLTSVPKGLANLTQLQELDLSDNKFTSLPSQIGKFSQLITLRLQHNLLPSLPSWIGDLAHLQNLYVGGNQLTSLPSEIGKLTLLRELYLGLNLITSLPNELVNLTELRELILDMNQLTSLPNGFSNLTNLKELGLSHNQFTSMPSEIDTQRLNPKLEGNPLSLHFRSTAFVKNNTTAIGIGLAKAAGAAVLGYGIYNNRETAMNALAYAVNHLRTYLL